MKQGVASEKSLAQVKKDEGKGPEPKVERKLKGDTGAAHRILLKPVITEKSAILADMGKYVFEVAQGANKVEIAKAVKMVYGVHPTKVNLIKLPGQKVVLRYKSFVNGQTKDQRKAIVTVKKGEKIPLFE
ncbi:50S ribosomal protein L23 [Candidatus Uhrbacteria bacterium]|nr:50S ribosomal protein L23 [Candidatus Uhrbacteria bacterium]